MNLEPAASRLLVIAALPDEVRDIVRRFRLAPASAREGARLWTGEGLAVGCTGVGHLHAQGRAAALVSDVKPARILLAGFCGGARAWAVSGTVVRATSVVSLAGPSGQPGKPMIPTWKIQVKGRGTAAPPTLDGALLTLSRVLVQPGEKRAWARVPDAAGFDCETAGWARVAEASGAPWAAVRVVLDGWDDPLAFDYDRFVDADGWPQKGRMIRHALVRPATWMRFAADGFRARRAGRVLAGVVEAAWSSE